MKNKTFWISGLLTIFIVSIACSCKKAPVLEKRVVKVFFLCSEQYCSNYRPSTRKTASLDSGQEYLGFRCEK